MHTMPIAYELIFPYLTRVVLALGRTRGSGRPFMQEAVYKDYATRFLNSRVDLAYYIF